MNKGIVPTNVIIIGIVVLLGAAALVYFVTNQKSGQMQTASPSPQAVSEEQATPAASPVTGTEKVINVSGSEYVFSPKSIEVKAGESVKLVYKNTGNLPHDLRIDELGVKTNVIGGGKEDMVSFTPAKSGTFTFYCSVGNHRQLGMEGEVVVK